MSGLRHNLTTAANLYYGDAYYERYNNGPTVSPRGTAITLPYVEHYGAITTADRDGLVTTVDPASGATLTLRSTVTGMVNADSVVTLDTPRNVTLYSAADQSTKSITVTGTDIRGAAMVETITGPDGTSATKIAQGAKAFKTISSIVATGDFGTIEVGFGTIIGLPFHASTRNKVIPLKNGHATAPYVVTTSITAIGTAQDVATVLPIGGVIAKLTGVSAAANGSASSTVTVTNATLEVGILVFTSSYAALTVIEDTTLLNTRVASGTAIKIATDGTGDGAGQAEVQIVVNPAVVTAADDTTATATTGDVRGTVDFGHGIDGTNIFSVVMYPVRTTKALAHGITQYSV